jgi:RHS repeat-associated protein
VPGSGDHRDAPAPSPLVGHARLSLPAPIPGRAAANDAPPTVAPSAARVRSRDPRTHNYNADQDCYIENGANASTNFCGSPYLGVGYNSGSVYRSALLFNIQDAIPAGAQVTHAGLAAYLSSTTTSNYGSVSAYQLTQPWTDGVTWNDTDGTDAWTTAGGTYASTDLKSLTPSTAGYYYWNGPTISALAQSWLSGTQANDGLLLKADDESNNEADLFNSTDNWSGPYFYVYYVNALGDPSTGGTASQQLTDRSSLSVNVANGNLVVDGSDLNIQGTGLSLSVQRTYNSLGEGDAFGTFLMDSGVDELLTFVSGDVFYQGPGGYNLSFYPNGSGGYISPPGLNSTLVENSGGSYTLTDDSSGEQLNFTSGGVLTSDVDRNGYTITYTMSGSNLGSITDTQGRQVTFTYGSSVGSNLISKITDSTGRTWQYGYTSASGYPELTSYTDPNGKVTGYAYNSSGLITEITDPLGNETTFTYNADDQVTSITRVTNTGTGAGPTTTYAYYPNQTGSCASPTGDVLGGYTVATNPDGFSSTFCYDLQGLVIQTIDPDSDASSSTYTADQQVATSTDPLSEATTATYNTNNDPTDVTAPADGSGQTAPSETAAYNTPSTVSGYQYLPSSITDAEGNCTAFVYDSAGNVTDTYAGQTSPCDGDTGGVHTATRYQGDPGISCGAKTGEVCEVIDGNGNVTTYAYNSAGEETGITPPSPLGAETITYDALSRVASVTDGKSQKTTYSYDGVDRVTQILYGGATTCTPSSGNCISHTFDADGNQTSMVDQSGTTHYYYDALNRLTTESLPDTTSDCAGSSPAGITYGYDAVGNKVTYCDSGGTTTYSFDPDNRLIAESESGGTCPTASTPTFVQGAETTSSTSLAFPQGVRAKDLLVLALTTNDSGTDPVTGVTDTLNGSWTRAKSVAEGNGHVDLYYFQGSAQGPDTVTLQGGSAAFTLAEYAGVAGTSALDQVAGGTTGGTTLSAGPTGTIGGAGELVIGTAGQDNVDSGFAAGTGFTLRESAVDNYWAVAGLEDELSTSTSGPSMTMGVPSGAAVGTGYAGAIVAVFKAAPAASLCTTFSYDANGDQTQITFPGGATQATTYNNDGQITSVLGKSSTGTTLTSFAYTYANGAYDTSLVQTQTENDAVASNTYTYSYNAYNDLTAASVTSGSGTSYGYTYDGDGNMLTKTAGSATTTYAFNTADELCWAYTGTSSNTCSSAPSGATTYSFDADGNETASSAGDSFSYNTKNQTTSITHGGTTLSGLSYTGQGQNNRTSAGSTTFDNSTSGTAVSTTSGSSTYYLYDNQGDVLGERIGSNHYYFLTNALGSVVAVINGSGQTVSDRYGYDPYGNTTYASVIVPNPYGYAGGYTDATGLIHFGARYYDPSTARWTQVDPAWDGGSAPFAYANDNPANAKDLSGLAAFSIGTVVIYALGSGYFVIVGKVNGIILEEWWRVENESHPLPWYEYLIAWTKESDFTFPDSENFADEGRINPVSWWAYFEGGGLAITERGEQQFVWVDLAYF